MRWHHGKSCDKIEIGAGNLRKWGWRVNDANTLKQGGSFYFSGSVSRMSGIASDTAYHMEPHSCNASAYCARTYPQCASHRRTSANPDHYLLLCHRLSKLRYLPYRPSFATRP